MPVVNPGAEHVASQLGKYEPQRKNNWCIEFTLGDGNAEEILSLSLKGSPFPKQSNAKKQIKYFNETRHYAGAVDAFEALSVKFHDYVDRAVFASLYAWRKQVWNPDSGAIGLASTYKKYGRLYLYPPNVTRSVAASGSSARTWKLFGCWPVSVTADDLDMESDGENVEITCEVSIDRALPEFTGESGVNGLDILGMVGINTPGAGFLGG